MTPFVLAAGLVGVVILGIASPSNRAPARALTALCLLAGLALSLRGATPVSGEVLRLDAMAAAWQGLFCLGTLPLILVMETAGELPFVLALGSVLGMALLAAANHLFALFLGLELMSLSTYLLIVSLQRDRRTLEATIKYFFSGALAAALFLLGLAVYYSKTGSFRLSPLPADSAGASLGLLLMLCAAFFKVGAFPMQFWLPDAYEAAEPELAGFMSTAVKSAGFLLMLRLGMILPASGAPGLDVLLPWLACATMTFGNLLALRQRSLQRLLAYSSMAHVGYLLAGVWAWLRLGASPEGAATVYLYLAAYLFMNTGAFLFVRLSGVRESSALSGLASRAPQAAGLFALMLVSLAAVPPTGGFLAKFYVLWDILRAGGVWLAVAVALNSVIALGYYFNMIRLMYFDEPRDARAPLPAQPAAAARLAAVACALATALLGLLPWARSWVAGWFSSIS